MGFGVLVRRFGEVRNSLFSLLRLVLGAGHWVVNKVSGAQRLQNMLLRGRVVRSGTISSKSIWFKPFVLTFSLLSLFASCSLVEPVGLN